MAARRRAVTVDPPELDSPATHESRDEMLDHHPQARTDVRNVIIIRSGPAGYTASVYAARANLTPLLFEGAVTAGGALMNPTEVENVAGLRDGIMGPDPLSTGCSQQGMDRSEETP